MDLVTWNDPLTGATGRSGTRYGLLPAPTGSPERSGEAQGWIVTADDEEICVADSAFAAVSRIEHLEALRCFIRGMAAEMTGDQLSQAKAVVAEMAEATSQSLSEDVLSPEDADQAEQSHQALISLRTMIAREQERRWSVPGRASARLH